MNQEIIQNFLKIPGIVGVALIEGQEESYFYIKEELIDDQEKQALTQNILEIIAKTHKGFEFFEFRVMGYYAYTYKLNPQLTLLILTNTDIAAIKLRALAAKQLKAELQRHTDSAITMFWLLTRKIPKPEAALKTPESYRADNSNVLLEVKVTIQELLLALNHLSQFSSKYIGSKLAVNYWQSTRPKFDWLDNFQISRSAELAFSGIITEYVSNLQHQWVKEWTAAFIKRCSEIIQNLPIMIEECLDEGKKRLLLTSTETLSKVSHPLSESLVQSPEAQESPTLDNFF